MLASTAIPIDKTTPAIPAKVKTIGVESMKLKKIRIKQAKIKEMAFSGPESLDLRILIIR